MPGLFVFSVLPPTVCEGHSHWFSQQQRWAGDAQMRDSLANKAFPGEGKSPVPVRIFLMASDRHSNKLAGGKKEYLLSC